MQNNVINTREASFHIDCAQTCTITTRLLLPEPQVSHDCVHGSLGKFLAHQTSRTSEREVDAFNFGPQGSDLSPALSGLHKIE